MITATEAFGTEPCEKDEWRNRILLSVGEMSWHITRAEAEELARQLVATLEASEADVFEGVLRMDRGRFFLETEGGERTRLLPRDWSIRKHVDEKIRVKGREKPDHGIYVHEAGPHEA